MDENIIIENLPDWPIFDLKDDIPVAKIDDWKQFAGILEDPFFNRLGTQLVFRGQRRADWGLTPSLGRLDANGIITEAVANRQMIQFRHAIRGRISDNALLDCDDDFELWAVGQHHGLNTPLIDWSYSPFVALFFAFEKEDIETERENQYRAVYVLNKSYVEQVDKCKEVNIFEPRKDDHGRLVNQAGLFTYSQYGSTLEKSLINSLRCEVLPENENDNENDARVLSEYICKIYISNEERQKCLNHLKRMNVHHASLFPDLIGASQFCNIEISVYKPVIDIPIAIDTPTITTGDTFGFSLADIPATYQEVECIVYILTQMLGENDLGTGVILNIAKQISKEIKCYMVVDWKIREPILARMRSVIRIILRKNSFPIALRENTVNQIMQYITSE